MNADISVIIPYYQGQRYLPELLSMMERNAKILRDEAGKETEVLLVNDSPWESLEENQNLREDRGTSFRLRILTNPENSDKPGKQRDSRDKGQWTESGGRRVCPVSGPGRPDFGPLSAESVQSDRGRGFCYRKRLRRGTGRRKAPVLFKRFRAGCRRQFKVPVLLQQSDPLTGAGPDPQSVDPGILVGTDHEKQRLGRCVPLDPDAVQRSQSGNQRGACL